MILSRRTGLDKDPLRESRIVFDQQSTGGVLRVPFGHYRDDPAPAGGVDLQSGR